MSNKTIITIERLTACGGLYIGRRLAERLQVPCYDREILSGAARILHLEEDILAGRDENLSSFWEKVLGTFSVGTPETEYAPPPFPMVEDKELFRAESAAIRAAADKGGGVFIGHGAATVLEKHSLLLRVFCHAPRDWRISRLQTLYPNYNDQDAARAVDASDLQQQKYLQAVSGINWRDATAYDLSINTALTGIDEAVEVIISAAARLLAKTDERE